jgi:hypothetical protein
LQGRRLRIAKGLRETAALTRERAAFRMKQSSSTPNYAYPLLENGLEQT